MLNIEKNIEEYRNREDYVNVAELINLQAELNELKGKKSSKFISFIDKFILNGKEERINKKRYILLAVSLGWLVGAHKFYAKKYIGGVLYLLFFWTGIPFALTLLDLMAVIPKEADDVGEILI